MESMFIKYQHIERFGTEEVDGINFGTCYVFPKIDGTNASVWIDDNQNIHAGSRTRELSIEKDNAGFYSEIIGNKNILKLLLDFPSFRLFGEWLVPHSLKTYRDDAWRKFYVFDVCEIEDGKLKYLNYDYYSPILEQYGIDYITPLRIIKNGTYEQFVFCLDGNNYLIKDGMGSGEGIVIKNYDFVNKYGRTVWAKIVTSEFKEKHVKAMGAPEVNGRKMVEEEIAAKYVTRETVEKIYNKIKLANNGWSSRYIQQLLGIVFYELIKENAWEFVKEHRNPRIDFKTLNHFAISKTKEVMPELF